MNEICKDRWKDKNMKDILKEIEKEFGKKKGKGKEIEIDKDTDAFWDLWKDKKTISPVATKPRQIVRPVRSKSGFWKR